mmetsp:Transcript_13954/g.30657  ORF Transcript_13954/g.30657 Transcript_13954/m.30657 type:complete len:200 (-) Transcript_13954:93-692(-)
MFPWRIHSNGNFLVETEVRESSVAGGGLGRFACEALRVGDIVRKSPLLDISDFTSMNPPGHIPKDEDFAVVIKDVKDLENWVEHFAVVADKEEIRKMTSWFLAAVFQTGTHGKEPICFIHLHSFHANHRIPSNLCVCTEGSFLLVKAIADIRVGDEFFTNYMDYPIDPVIAQWFASHGLTDVKTFAERSSVSPSVSGSH